MGVNLGDIYWDDEDIYGDDVNIAARLEGLADPEEALMKVHRKKFDQLFRTSMPTVVGIRWICLMAQ
jgi:hypothetical protein